MTKKGKREYAEEHAAREAKIVAISGQLDEILMQILSLRQQLTVLNLAALKCKNAMTEVRLVMEEIRNEYDAY